MSGRWWWLLFLAALVVLLGAGAALLSARPRDAALSVVVAPVPPAGGDAGAECPDARRMPERVLVGAEDAAALLVAEPKVTLMLDGLTVPGQSGTPVRLKAGVRALQAEAGGDLVRLQLSVDAFRPVLVHAAVDPQVGLTVVYLGAWCASCPGADAAPPLGVVPSTTPVAELLSRAAHALAESDWSAAHQALQQVPLKQRASVTFARLAASVMQATRQTSLAKEALRRSGEPRIRSLLDALEALAAQEPASRSALTLQRWNLLTERYARLVELAPEAPGPIAAASARFGELSSGFVKASEQHQVDMQEETVEAAHETIAVMVRGLRAANPSDCGFQMRVSQAF